MEYLIIMLIFLIATGFLARHCIRVFKGENCYFCSHDCSSCKMGRQNMAKEIILKENDAN